jgi:hypothetical protein
VAGAAPHIKDPKAWFGWFATSASGADVDLEGIAEALLAKEDRGAAPVPPLDPSLGSLVEAFTGLVGADRAVSYLAGGKLVEEGSTKRFRAASRTSHRRLSTDLAAPFASAARACGFATEPLPPLRR